MITSPFLAASLVVKQDRLRTILRTAKGAKYWVNFCLSVLHTVPNISFQIRDQFWSYFKQFVSNICNILTMHVFLYILFILKVIIYFASPEIIEVKICYRQTNSLVPNAGVCGFFLSVKFSTSLLTSLAGG